MYKKKRNKPAAAWSFIAGLFCAFLLFTCNVSCVAAAEPAPRQKIGLALGGGGAAGYSHIGVLQWLEDHHIPVDYITGTSMGGLIGGCYAMGMSPEEIRLLIKNIPWDQMFDSIPPFNALDFRRKEDQRDYPIETEIGLGSKGVKLPMGLSAHRIGLLLSRLTLPYSTVDKFDDLVIPYRCVTTDIRNYESVVLDSGSLAEAMRATMAIPGVFTPVEREGRMLVDGGVLNNVPADVAREMGADHVIAVDLNFGPQAGKIAGLDEVLIRTLYTVIANNSRKNLADAVVISPSFNLFDILEWELVDKFMALGYKAAEEKAVFLKQFSVDQNTWDQYIRQRQSRQRSFVPVPLGIEVKGTTPVNAAYIKNRLKRHAGNPIDVQALEDDLNDIIGCGLYAGFRYEYAMAGNIPVLLITAIMKDYGPNFVDFTLLMATGGDISLRFRTTIFNAAGSGSELRADLGFGSELYLASELYKQLSGSHLFAAPSVSFEQKNGDIFDAQSRITDYNLNESRAGLDIGYTFSKFGEARAGYYIGYQKAWTRVGNPLPGDFDGTVRMGRLKFTYNNGDSAILPRKGFFWETKGSWYYNLPGCDEEFGLVENKIVWHIPVRQKDSLFINVSGGNSLAGTPPFFQQFKLGGPFRLGSFFHDELCGNSFLMVSAGYLKYLTKFKITGKPVYLGAWLEYGGVGDNLQDIEFHSDLTTGFLSPTVLGPVYFGASFGKNKNLMFHITLGRVF